jgi:ABC-type phosphate transport system substrate-binding protein
VAFHALAGAAAEPPELSIVVHPQNRGPLNGAQLEQIFLTTLRQWPQGGAPVAVFNLPPRSEARVLFDAVALRMSEDEVARFWIDRKIRGGEPPPRQVPDPGIMVRAVAQIAGAIGYAPSAAADASVRVIARIKDRKLVWA